MPVDKGKEKVCKGCGSKYKTYESDKNICNILRDDKGNRKEFKFKASGWCSQSCFQKANPKWK